MNQKHYESIPQVLKDLPQWVCTWNNSKIPMQANIMKASSSSNPSLWSTYEEAKARVEDGTYDNLGFVFDNNYIVGIDIDVGFDEEDMVSDIAQDIINHCHSYTELSRSGRGMHIYLIGDIPFAGKNNGAGVEIYKSNRYFIVTGKRLKYERLSANQEGIDYVLEKYFKDIPKEKEINNKSGSKIYKPVYRTSEGKLSLKPIYPEVSEGARHISMVSMAGQLHNSGATFTEVYCQLLEINKQACKPPLNTREIESIVNSVCKYKR